MNTDSTQLLKWKDEFSLGIPEVDFEHRELIELINQSILKINEADSTEDSLYFLGEIHARISSHFALEEKIMRDLGYSDFSEHKDDHDRLLDEIRDLMDEYENDLPTDTNSFIDRLSHWFGDHFKTRDAQLHKFLNKAQQ